MNATDHGESAPPDIACERSVWKTRLRRKLIGKAGQSVVLCLLFLNKKGGVELIKQAGARGYFFGTIAPEDFVTCIEDLIAGQYSENGGFVWIH